MATFSYRALKSDGKIAEGVLDAGSRPDALRQIETLGLRPVNVLETISKAAKNGSRFCRGWTFARGCDGEIAGDFPARLCGDGGGGRGGRVSGRGAGANCR